MSDYTTYINLGAGALALITLIALFRHMILKQTPAINRLNQTCAINDKVLENNTAAINNNTLVTQAVSEVINLLNTTVCNQNQILEKVYNKTSIIENHVVNLDGYMRGRQDNLRDGKLRQTN